MHAYGENLNRPAAGQVPGQRDKYHSDHAVRHLDALYLAVLVEADDFLA